MGETSVMRRDDVELAWGAVAMAPLTLGVTVFLRLV
jgi:hypothetical protein